MIDAPCLHLSIFSNSHNSLQSVTQKVQ